MARWLARWTIAWIAALGAAGAARAGGPVFLSNTPVSPDAAADNFQGAVPSIWAERTESAGDVRVHSVAFRGLTGTAGEGFFLYSYEIESLNVGTVYVTDFLVDVAGRVAFDLDADASPETSAYCSNFCVNDLTGTYPDQVFIESGDRVDFRFALLEHSTQLWIVSTHPPATLAATVTKAFGAGDVAIDVVAPSATTTGVLGNLEVVWGSPAHTRVANLFGVNLGASPAGDGYAVDAHFYTGARTGNAGTAAEGLYLYEYWFETGCAAPPHRLEIPFGSLVPFDFDGDGDNETAFYMPYSSGCGTASVANPAAIDGQELIFDYPAGVAGGIANVYVVSDLAPEETHGFLVVDGVGSGPFRTWAAPEPAAVSAGAAAALALAALRRRHSQA
jgi:hypothetical protein